MARPLAMVACAFALFVCVRAISGESMGSYPLHDAAARASGHPEDDPDAWHRSQEHHRYGGTALIPAAERGHVEQALLAAGGRDPPGGHP